MPVRRAALLGVRGITLFLLVAPWAQSQQAPALPEAVRLSP